MIVSKCHGRATYVREKNWHQWQSNEALLFTTFQLGLCLWSPHGAYYWAVAVYHYWKIFETTKIQQSMKSRLQSSWSGISFAGCHRILYNFCIRMIGFFLLRVRVFRGYTDPSSERFREGAHCGYGHVQYCFNTPTNSVTWTRHHLQ